VTYVSAYPQQAIGILTILTVGFLIIGQESLLIGLGYKVGSGRAEAPDGGSLQLYGES